MNFDSEIRVTGKEQLIRALKAVPDVGSTRITLERKDGGKTEFTFPDLAQSHRKQGLEQARDEREKRIALYCKRVRQLPAEILQ